jgi:hypothetical protein
VGRYQEVVARKNMVDNEQELEKLEQEIQLLTRTLADAIAQSRKIIAL